MKILDVLTSPWAIMPDKYLEIIDVYSRHLKGDKIDVKAIEAKAGYKFNSQHHEYEVIDGVAVISIHGVMAKRMNLFHAISGGASTEMVGNEIRAALADREVKSILLDIDSPGGAVDGTADLGNLISSMRGQKPIATLADGLIASAGYWAGSAADQVYITNETTVVGSIGVVSTHVDYSEQLKQRGITVNEIYAGKFKRLSSQYKPLTEEGRQDIQSTVDYLYSIFVETVAKHRGVSVDTVLENMADGRLFIGQQAIDAGLVDGVSTREALIDKLSSGSLPEIARSRASIDLGGDRAVTTYSGTNTVSKSVEALAIADDGSLDTNHNGGDSMEITKEYISENHPEIAQAFREEGKEQVNIDDIRTEAAASERNRIKDVYAKLSPGYEADIEGMMFDGSTTGERAAATLWQKDKEKREATLSDLQSDSESSRVSQDVETESGDSKKASPKEVAAEARALVKENQKNGIEMSFAQAVRIIQRGDK